MGRPAIFLGVWVLLFLLSTPSMGEEKGGFQFDTEPAIEQIRPEKPVRIKLRRLSGGKYTWELLGYDADQVIEADRKLREYLKTK